MELFYGNLSKIEDEKEQETVEFVQECFVRTRNGSSKLNGTGFLEDFKKAHPVDHKHVTPYYHLLNNLCDKKDAHHLHVGLYQGGSFVAALLNNEGVLRTQIGVDLYEHDFQYYHERMTRELCKKHLTGLRYEIIVGDAFSADLNRFQSKIDVYLYDADHCFEAQEKAFTYYNPVLADVFIAIVDDWNCEKVTQGTFSAFDKLEYRVLHEDLINSHYVAVIKKAF